jgi:cold shock CspA family protein
MTENELHTGYVMYFDSFKKYGQIQDDNGDTVYLHQSEIVGNNKFPATGQRIEYLVKYQKDKPRPRALKVRLI